MRQEIVNGNLIEPTNWGADNGHAVERDSGATQQSGRCKLQADGGSRRTACRL
jgi:hypothetical protein